MHSEVINRWLVYENDMILIKVWLWVWSKAMMMLYFPCCICVLYEKFKTHRCTLEVLLLTGVLTQQWSMLWFFWILGLQINWIAYRSVFLETAFICWAHTCTYYKSFKTPTYSCALQELQNSKCCLYTTCLVETRIRYSMSEVKCQ